MTRQGIFLVCCLAALIGLLGCSRGVSLPSRIQGIMNDRATSVLKLGLEDDPGMLNPIFHLGENAKFLCNMIHGAPLRRKSGGGFLPDLWKEWETRKDTEGNLVVEGTWREGLCWHDGVPFSTKDFDFTMDSIRKPENSSPYCSLAKRIKAVEHSVEENKTRITFFGSSRQFLELLCIGLIPAHLLQNQDLQNAVIHIASPTEDFGVATETPKFSEIPIGIGPFKIVGKKERRFLELHSAASQTIDSSSSKTGSSIPVTKVLIRFYYRPEDMVEDLRSGKLDWAKIPSEFSEKIEELKISKVKFFRYSNPSYLLLGFNTRRFPFNNRDLRIAIDFGISRKNLSHIIPYEGKWLVGPPIAPEAFLKFENEFSRIEEARKILDKAGLTDSDGDGIREMGGKPLSFKILINQDNVLRKMTAESICEDLKKIGIKATVQTLNWTEMVTEHLEKGEFDSFLLNFFAPREGNWVNLWHSSAAEFGNGSDTLDAVKLNFSGFSDPELDSALAGLDEFPENPNKEELKRIIWNRLATEVPGCFLFSPGDVCAFSESLSGFETSGDIWDQRIESWRKKSGGNTEASG